MFDIVEPFPLLSQTKARGWRAIGSKRRALAGHYLCWVDRFSARSSHGADWPNEPARRAPRAGRARRVSHPARQYLGGGMKKLINAPDDVVPTRSGAWRRRTGTGFGSAMTRIWSSAPTPRCRARSDSISGGGSGHEPMHGGFVGPGMLDAACPGEVFTSPTPDQMAEATKAVNGGAGVLHIVKNYTGDVMNFDMAAELDRCRGHRGRDGPHQRRRRRGGLAVHRGPPRRRDHRDRREDLRRRGRRRPIPGGGGRARPQGERQRAVDGHGADAVHHARLRGSRASSSPTTRSRSGSGSTASRAASARRSDPHRRSPSG